MDPTTPCTGVMIKKKTGEIRNRKIRFVHVIIYEHIPSVI